jgi:hypothetical protein
MKLLNDGDEISFLEMTGFNFAAFRSLRMILFEPEITEALAGVRPRGRPSQLDFDGQLGLYLYFVNSMLRIKHLCQIFGVTPTTVSIVINRMIRRVIKKLKTNAAAMIRYPTLAEKEQYAEMIRVREPLVNDVIGFIDGVSIPVQCSDEESEQNAMYNGYHCDTMCNNVFLFYPTGKIGSACINFPGSWHDSTTAEALINWSIENLGSFKFCVDQGFPRSGKLHELFVGPLSKKSRRNLAPILRNHMIELHNLYVSLRQSSEWGMRALQGSFSRLKSRLTSNKLKRYHIIAGIALLHNYRTEFVGINQIATVFNPHYEQYINISGYDRIARYYEQTN